MGSRPLLTVPDKVAAVALSLLQCQIHPAHGLDLFLCVNLIFKSHSNFFSQLYSTTCITPKTRIIRNIAVYNDKLHMQHM